MAFKNVSKKSSGKKPELCIIAGPNGSGKTTVTKALLQHKWGQDCTYINPDETAEKLFGHTVANICH